MVTEFGQISNSLNSSVGGCTLNCGAVLNVSVPYFTVKGAYCTVIAPNVEGSSDFV